ncbi:hypothetical protein PsorP6_011615 [Peronosclerospora sorghi]|uniref:Uncharacterized protein n=1 Tax=Peronosclerospora sorghi TaxID=230839 RepID=A0ACC0WLY9_9STRA|nr:hypothetical protein PsorP6_011615 [Peronosclerospora sorghi]
MLWSTYVPSENLSDLPAGVTFKIRFPFLLCKNSCCLVPGKIFHWVRLHNHQLRLASYLEITRLYESLVNFCHRGPKPLPFTRRKSHVLLGKAVMFIITISHRLVLVLLVNLFAVTEDSPSINISLVLIIFKVNNNRQQEPSLNLLIVPSSPVQRAGDPSLAPVHFLLRNGSGDTLESDGLPTHLADNVFFPLLPDVPRICRVQAPLSSSRAIPYTPYGISLASSPAMFEVSASWCGLRAVPVSVCPLCSPLSDGVADCCPSTLSLESECSLGGVVDTISSTSLYCASPSVLTLDAAPPASLSGGKFLVLGALPPGAISCPDPSQQLRMLNMDEGAHDAGTRHTDWRANSDGPTMHIHTVVRDVHEPHVSENHNREGFVYLMIVHVT